MLPRTEFWLEQLSGFEIPTQLPISKGHNLNQTLESDRSQELKLSSSIGMILGCLDRELDLDIETILLGAWAILLSRYSSSADVLFGINTVRGLEFVGGASVKKNRVDIKGESLHDSLPMRVKVEPDKLLLPWLKELQVLHIEIRDGEHPSLEQICKLSGISQQVNLFESLLVFNNGNLDAEHKSQSLAQINYPLVLEVFAGEPLCLTLYYDDRKFETDAIDRMLGHFQTLVEGMVANFHQTLAEVPMLTAAERHQLLVEWNDTQVDYPRNKTVDRVFAEQVDRTPDAIAVILPALDGTSDSSLTYRQLDDRSHSLAMALQEIGVGTEIPVAMCLERSIESIVAILGILKAGGVYVPLDPAYPPERLALMLADIPSPVILTQSHLVDRLPPHAGRVICLDVEMPQPRSIVRLSGSTNAENLAYINFTSGSTGKPKGVAIPHRAVLRLVLGSQFTPLDGERTLLQLAPTSFDAATLEIWGALLHGGRCVLFPGNGIPDVRSLRTIISNYKVTTLWLTAALFNTIVAEAPETLQGVSEILTGGEALSPTHIRQAQLQLVGTQLVNGYGPTESTTFTCCYRIPNPIDPQATSIAIGRPIANTQVYILDAALQPVPIGIPGELYIGGDGLARGYVDRPELTAERFVAHPFNDDPNARLYKTGDLVRYLADGNIEFIGRSDDQVKIRGYRIELGEIETKLSQHPTVREAIVIMRSARLVAYVTAADRQSVQPHELKAALRATLPEYMVPNAIVVLAKMPLTANGKADRRALPDLQMPIDPNFVAPSTATERTIAEIWSDVLSLERVGIESNFFDLGGTSLLGLQMVTRVQKQLNADFRAVKLYQYPTIRTLARFLDRADTQNLPKSSHDRSDADRSTSTDVAIIGMVGRFPGANDVAEFWHNLCEGIDTNSWFTDAQIDPSIDPELRADPNYVRARGVLADADMFDAAFFGISPREAEIMDPQARIFLELAHQALETVGYTPDRYDGEIGLYAGSGQNTYFEKHICTRSEIVDRLGEFLTMLANEKDFLTTRTSYKLGLTGPSLSINTACSTSLVAIIQAVRSLSDRHCDMAIAGGISITTPQNRGYLYQEGGMLSPDGRCRPFDANAGGTLFNSGAGIVVLKRVEDALADGDRIYAVIKGVGLNNDGADKVSFTAPSVNGQAAAIAMAHADCGFDPKTISYVETHGTATAMGDPIEIEALTLAFQQPAAAEPFCAIGSLKGNIGHVVAAAGVAGVIKTALALDRQLIPPSINFESPNPAIDFANSPFFVNTQLTPWKPGATPLRAGVSSFGVGGTNAHIILEQAPTVPPASASRPCQLLVLSAKTATAIDKATANLQAYLAQTTENLADIAFTLQQGRTSFNHRRTIVCRDAAEAVSILETKDVKGTATRQTELRNPDVVFMFPGQGSQYVEMGANLYQTEPVFRDAVDRCAEILIPLLGRDLRTILYPHDSDREAATIELRQTQFTQPAIFTVEYALAQLWQSWGIKPAAAIGHSIGEFVAACLAGVFSLADGLKLIATRGRMMGDLPAGSMLSVLLPAAEVTPYLSEELSIAAINGPSLCVVSGSTALIAQLQQQLEAKEIGCKPLHTSHAFHSPMMEPILPAFAELAHTIELSPPQIPFVSTVTGTWITDAQATDYLYWTNHLRATVRFAEGIQTLWQVPERVLLEVGPRATAATLARQQITDRQQQIAIASLGSSADDNAEWTSIIHAIGQLWRAGVEIDWNAFYRNEYRRRTPLPTYPFDRHRYWIDPKPFPVIARSLPPVPQSPSLPVPTSPIGEATPTTSLSASQSPSPPVPSSPSLPVSPTPMTTRKLQLLPILKSVLETTSGFDVSDADEVTTFLEMGLDSLSLTQVAIALKKQFKIKITFRNLLEDYPNLGTLADFLDNTLPADALPAPASAPVAAAPAPVAPDPVAANGNGNGNGNSNANGNGNRTITNPLPIVQNYPAEGMLGQHLQGAVRELARGLIQGLAQELDMLAQGGSLAPSIPTPAPTVAPTPAPAAPAPTVTAIATPAPIPTKSSGPGAKIEKTVTTVLTGEQQAHLNRIVDRYNNRTQESKRQAQEHRRYLADPRTVSGFTPLLKEMVYQIVIDRSAGSKLWDVDGNEYIDITNGFGLNFFGWNPDFVTKAVMAQMEKGIEIGPQTPLAGKVAKSIVEFTGMERVAFCNTGSEAVMATLRLARTVTGRNLIATFNGDYHGTFDEVLYRQGPKQRTLPAAPGLMSEMFENLLVLDYGTPESLAILRERADELAGILVEPVRSRDPGFQPREFLQELRTLTTQSETALIFDEVVTGFRVHPGGAQAYFDIQADMATYGKVVGGGLPIGIVAGKAEYMDALDGGFWEFGDNSIPEVGVTFFAGTFVRHPMALAAAAAVLDKLKAGGPELQLSLSAKVEKFVKQMRQHFDRVGAPIKIEYFSSFFYVTYPAEVTYGSLLFYLLREKGVHIWEYRPCFFTLAHTDEDIEFVARAFKDTVAELQTMGFLPGISELGNLVTTPSSDKFDSQNPPQAGARLGKDPDGNLAWYIPDLERPGKYLQMRNI